MVDQRPEPQEIARAAETCYLSQADRSDDRAAAERFPGMDVRQMHLDRGQPHPCQGIAHGNAVVGQRPGIDHDAIRPFARLLDGIDDLPFVVRLQDAGLRAQSSGFGLDPEIDLIEGLPAVQLRLPPAEQIEVGAVQDQNLVLQLVLPLSMQ